MAAPRDPSNTFDGSPARDPSNTVRRKPRMKGDQQLRVAPGLRRKLGQDPPKHQASENILERR